MRKRKKRASIPVVSRLCLVAEAFNFSKNRCANTAPSPSCVVVYRLRLLGSALSHFGRHRLRKRYLIVFASLTQRATLIGTTRRSCGTDLIFVSKKRKQPDWVASFLVAEAGFEPHDLRVMSPTSYQAAPLRDMVPETGIEPVRYFRITGF